SEPGARTRCHVVAWSARGRRIGNLTGWRESCQGSRIWSRLSGIPPRGRLPQIETLNFHGSLGGVISHSFVLSRNLPMTPIRAIVNDRPSRLFSAQQEALQRSLGWPLSSRHLSSPLPPSPIPHPPSAIRHLSSAIRHLSSAISPSPFPVPHSAFRIPHFLTGGDDATLLTTLEALLNALPAVASTEEAPKLEAHLAAASSDFAALEKLRKLAFTDQVPAPARQMLLPIPTDDVDNDMSEE